MKMKCLDHKICSSFNPYCYYDTEENSIGCECIQAPSIYLDNHPDATEIPLEEEL